MAIAKRPYPSFWEEWTKPRLKEMIGAGCFAGVWVLFEWDAIYAVALLAWAWIVGFHATSQNQAFYWGQLYDRLAAYEKRTGEMAQKIHELEHQVENLNRRVPESDRLKESKAKLADLKSKS